MNESTQSVHAALLPFLGVLRIGGDDAVRFLQGQLTNDVQLLADGRTQLAAYNTPQGRVIALPQAAPGRRRDLRAAAHGTARAGQRTPPPVRAAFQGGSADRHGPAGGMDRDCGAFAIAGRRGRIRCDPHRLGIAGRDCHAHGFVRLRARTAGDRGSPGRLALDHRAFGDACPPAHPRRVAGCGHSRRPATGVRSDFRSIRSADAEPRPARRDQFHEGLLHGTGDRRPYAEPRAHQAAHLSLSRRGRQAASPARGALPRRRQGRRGVVERRLRQSGRATGRDQPRCPRSRADARGRTLRRTRRDEPTQCPDARGARPRQGRMRRPCRASRAMHTGSRLSRERQGLVGMAGQRRGQRAPVEHHRAVCGRCSARGGVGPSGQRTTAGHCRDRTDRRSGRGGAPRRGDRPSGRGAVRDAGARARGHGDRGIADRLDDAVRRA